MSVGDELNVACPDPRCGAGIAQYCIDYTQPGEQCSACDVHPVYMPFGRYHPERIEALRVRQRMERARSPRST